MISIDKFVQKLEHKIASINNTLTKANIIFSLESIIPLLDEENIWELTQNEYNQLNKHLSGENKLSEEENNFVKFIINLTDQLRKIKKSIGLGKEQKNLLLSIQEKIKNARNSYSNEDIEKLNIMLTKYKVLLNKIKNNDINLITEFDLISEILEKNEFSTTEKLEIYEEINKININIFKNYNLKITEEEDIIISPESLIETNLESSKLEELFERFNIKWDFKNIKELPENKRKELKEKIEEYKKRLLKYGNYNKMQEILTFLKEKELSFIFEDPEILTKTLLYSTIEQINNIIIESNKRNINYKELLEKNRSIFFPPVKEFDVKIKHGKLESKGSSIISGSLTNYIKNLQLLDELGIPADKVYDDCSTFFIKSPKTAKKTYNRLLMYGISLKKQDGTLRKGFSALNTLDILKKLDIGIECGCYHYYQDNISKLTDSFLNLYRIKLARSQGIKDEEIFKYYKNIDLGCYLPARFGKPSSQEFGISPADTFKMYNAVNYDSKNIEIYDRIIQNNDNDIISEIVKEDEWIKKLDEKYKQNELIYNFDGVIISRLKVLRYYQTLITDESIKTTKDLLMYIITKNTMINQEEMNKISNCINRIIFKERILK